MITEKEALLYAKMPAFKNLLIRTSEFIRTALVKVKNPYVACSFGKDSSVMLHLIRFENPNIQVVFVEYEETVLLDNYEDVIRQWGDINLYRLFVQSEIDDEVNEKDILPEWASKNGYDAAFVGIRSEESKGRRISIKKHGKIYTAKTGQTRICPLADWKIKDIAAYCYTYQLPLLESYVKSGISERTTTGITGEEYGFRKAQLLRLKQNNISKYNILLSTYPKLAIYV